MPKKRKNNTNRTTDRNGFFCFQPYNKPRDICPVRSCLMNKGMFVYYLYGATKYDPSNWMSIQNVRNILLEMHQQYGCNHLNHFTPRKTVADPDDTQIEPANKKTRLNQQRANKPPQGYNCGKNVDSPPTALYVINKTSLKGTAPQINSAAI